jgi:hypothetical protein
MAKVSVPATCPDDMRQDDERTEHRNPVFFHGPTLNDLIPNTMNLHERGLTSPSQGSGAVAGGYLSTENR